MGLVTGAVGINSNLVVRLNLLVIKIYRGGGLMLIVYRCLNIIYEDVRFLFLRQDDTGRELPLNSHSHK